MATVSRDNIGLLNDRLTVNLTKDDYLPAFEQSVKKYAKQANIPGFRKGMVPAGMIKKMQGANIFNDEVLRTVDKELTKYLDAEKPDLIAQPLPLDTDERMLDMNNPSDYHFTFEIGLKPAIDVDVNNITVTRHVVNVTDQMIDIEIESLLEKYSRMTDAEEVTTEDNVLNVTFEESDATGNLVDDGIVKGNSVQVKRFLESFRNEIMGKKTDDFVVIRLNDSFETGEAGRITKELLLDEAGTVEKFFKMTITGIQLKEMPEMNEAFFSMVFDSGIVHEDDFRKALKENLQASWDGRSKNQLNDQIYHKLFDTRLDFPEDFLKRYIQLADEKVKTAEEAESQYPAFANSLKQSLITNKLLNKNNINVSTEEVKDYAKRQMFSYMGGATYEQLPWLESYAEKMLEDKKVRQNMVYELENLKLYDELEKQVNVIEDIVTPEELLAMEHNHNH